MNNSYTNVDWNPYRIPFDSDYHCSLPISVECTFVFHKLCSIYAVFVISCPSYQPPYISRVNVDVQTDDAFGASATERSLEASDGTGGITSYNPGVFKSISINCNASRLLSYLSLRIRSIYMSGPLT